MMETIGKFLALIFLAFTSCETEYNTLAVMHDVLSTDGSLVVNDSVVSTPKDSDSLDLEEWDWNDDPVFIPLDTASVSLTLSPTHTYNWWKSLIARKRENLRVKYVAAKTDSSRTAILDEAGLYLLNNIMNGLIPHWYGTPWDFNGHTNVPNEGNIACGYFVSTTLVHAGFNLNRYKLAQQGAYNEIRTLQRSGKIIKLINKDVSDLVSLGKSQLSDGLYVIGLDYHVGYLLRWKAEVYFVHSNYWYPSEVIIEHALHSAALKSSESYYIGELTTNKDLLKTWLMGSRITIVMD